MCISFTRSTHQQQQQQQQRALLTRLTADRTETETENRNRKLSSVVNILNILKAFKGKVEANVHTLDIAPLRIVNHHRRSAQVWNVFSRDLAVLPAHPYVHPQAE